MMFRSLLVMGISLMVVTPLMASETSPSAAGLPETVRLPRHKPGLWQIDLTLSEVTDDAPSQPVPTTSQLCLEGVRVASWRIADTPGNQETNGKLATGKPIQGTGRRIIGADGVEPD